MKPNKLTDEQLIQVIELAPLVSIDLVIRDSESRVLMGLRINKPAEAKWFVPGGRIYKNEALDKAFERISMAEVGQKLLKNDATFIGLFTHKYDDNFMDDEGINTHYIAIAYELCFTKPFSLKKSNQHSEFAWFAPCDTNPDIHKYSLKYLRHPLRMDEVQYTALNARRDSFNSLLWHTPILSLTAQAFLFTTIFSGDVSILARRLASVLAFSIALASIQLFAKHRFMEKQHTDILQKYERDFGRFNANKHFYPETWITKIKSHKVWPVLLWMFAIIAVFTFMYPEALSVDQKLVP